MKICTKCKKEKSISEFYKDKRNLDGYKGNCKVCDNKISLKWKQNNRKRNREIARKSKIKKLYSITINEYNKMFEEQNGRCAICNNLQPHKRLSVDHSHKTGKIRGLLCFKCNVAIGSLNVDNVGIDNLLSAVDYIRNNG